MSTKPILPGHIQINSEYIAVYDGENFTRLTLSLENKLRLLGELSTNVAHLLQVKLNEFSRHASEAQQRDKHAEQPSSANPAPRVKDIHRG